MAAPRPRQEESPRLIAVSHESPASEAATELQRAEEVEPNDESTSPQPIQAPIRVSGAIARPGDIDLYRIHAHAGETLTLEVEAARAKSRLDSRIDVLHPSGEPVEQVVLQATRESWFTFRGKDSDTSDDFRVHNWEQMELDEFLYANGEVVRLWLYPRGPDSGFKVYPGQGKRHTFFGTTPLVHALSEPCYIVQPLPAGSEPAPNGLPVFRIPYTNDDDPSRRFGSDSLLLFTAPATGEYLVRVTDVRGFGGDDYSYSLAVRPPQPGFKVAVGGTNPKVSPGSGRELSFRAERFEEVHGPIRIDIENLPEGFTASTPVEIEEGQFGAVAVLLASMDAPDPGPEADQAVRVVATATIHGREVRQELGSLGDIQRGPDAKVTVEIMPSSDRSFVSQSPDGLWEFTLRPGETITARVRAVRHDFEGRIELGGEDSGRNLPHGAYVDNIGLNGLLIVEGQSEREFFITASRIVRPGTRLFHLRAHADGGQASRPALLRIAPVESLAAFPP